MGRIPFAARSGVEDARMSLGISDELRDRRGRKRRIHHHDIGDANNACDRRDIANEIEIKILVERRIDRGRSVSEQQSVAICRCIDHNLGSKIGRGSWPVFDDKRLPEPFRKRLADQARNDVGAAACGKTDDDAHGPRRIIRRPCCGRAGSRQGWDCEHPGPKTQEYSTFHCVFDRLAGLTGTCPPAGARP